LKILFFTFLHYLNRFLNQELETQKALVNTPNLPQGILHGDIFPSNLIFSQDTHELLGIVDFEEICQGPLILDVAMAIVGCGFKGANEVVLDINLVGAFLKAYNAQRILTLLEQELLKRFIKHCFISIGFWRFRQFRVRYKTNSEVSNKYMEMVMKMNRLEETILSVTELI